MEKKKLDNYYVTGTARDHEWIINNREMFEESLRDEMRATGYIPVLDLPINITWEYDAKFLCHFKAHAKGLKVGRRRSMNTLGYMSKEGFIVDREAKQAVLT